MRNEITTILDALQKDDPAVIAMEKTILNLIDGQGDLYSIRDTIKNEVSYANRMHTERQPYYYLYLAIANLKIGDKKPAKDALSHAVTGFRIAGNTLNEALAEWFFGIIHLDDGKKIRSEQACRTALSLLNSLILDYEKKGAYGHADALQKHYKKIEKFTKEIGSKSKKKENTQTPSFPFLQIRFPWLEVYDSVQAGTNGIIWSDMPTLSRAKISVVEIDGKSYNLHPITLDEKDDHGQIDLSKKSNYGLAKVRGQSMNASKPIPIEEGDYVLFSTKWTRSQDRIVIAGYTLTDHEISTMVKRFIAQEKLLISETTDVSEDYSAVEITEDHQILGTVLAVAKLIK